MSDRAGTADRVAAYAAGFAVLGLVAFLLIRNQPVADANLATGLRILLSLCAAIFGATLPGMLKVDFSAKGLAIRATGALAMFVLTFVFTPTLVPQVAGPAPSAIEAGP